VPCSANPHLWELPTSINSLTDAWAACTTAGEAIAVCRTCPALRDCRLDAAANPPLRHVQAGLIYDLAGRPLHLYQWRKALQERISHRRGEAA